MKKLNVQFPPLGAQHAKQAAAKATNIVKNPVSKDQAIETAKKMIAETGAPPEEIVKLGHLAEQAIKDKKKYSDFVDYMVKRGMATKEQLAKPNFQAMTTLIIMGKVAKEM